METQLLIEGGGFPPLSARGCQQILTCANQGSFRRTVNGELKFISMGSAKYQSTITCEDKTSLVSDGILMRGCLVRIGCIQRLWQAGKEEGPIQLDRPIVEGSLGVVDANQEPVDFELDEKGLVNLKCDQNKATACFISYRPWLWMRVVNLKLFTDEWGLKAGWRLDLEEV